VTAEKIRLPRKNWLTPKKNTIACSNMQKETIARSSRKKRHYSVSKYKETISGQPAKRGTRLCSKRHSPASKRAHASVYARESSSERQRECVPERGRECKRQHNSARQPERVNKRLSKRLACLQAKNNTRLTPRKYRIAC